MKKSKWEKKPRFSGIFFETNASYPKWVIMEISTFRDIQKITNVYSRFYNAEHFYAKITSFTKVNPYFSNSLNYKCESFIMININI